MSSKPDQENDRLLSATATPDGVTGDIGKVCPSTTQKLQSGQKPFVTPAKATPAAKSAVFSALNTPILCPTYGNPIPHQVLAQALKEGHQIRSFFPEVSTQYQLLWTPMVTLGLHAANCKALWRTLEATRLAIFRAAQPRNLTPRRPPVPRIQFT